MANFVGTGELRGEGAERGRGGSDCHISGTSAGVTSGSGAAWPADVTAPGGDAFAAAVLAVVERIPPGRVMTYGDIGWAIGQPAPRAVGRVMALLGHGSAWWRVVPASGLPPQGHARLAYPHYVEEGTPLKQVVSPDDYRIALSSARLPFSHPIYGGAPGTRM